MACTWLGEMTCTWFPKTLEKSNFMGEMTCTWFPKTLAFSLKIY